MSGVVPSQASPQYYYKTIMASTPHPSELDSNAGDSVASSPRSDYSHDQHTSSSIRFMCSFGGQILPRPHDNQLRYVGGETRIVALHRPASFSALLAKLAKLSNSSPSQFSIKYQLPNEDLDALISVTSDEDLENMIDEYDRLNPKSSRPRLRLFLFPTNASLGSLLGGSNRRENWFFDALNGGGASLERGRSEVSSVISEVPDYLFGLDNSDESREVHKPPKNRPIQSDNVPGSDPGSPAPPITPSQYCSTSSALGVPSMPDLPPVRTKPPEQVNPNPNPNPVLDMKESPMSHGFGEAVGDPNQAGFVQQRGGYSGGNPIWHYVSEPHYPGQPVQPMPVYYMAGHVSGGTIPVHTGPVPMSYLPRYPGQVSGQVPTGYRNQVMGGVGQVYNVGPKPVVAAEGYELPAGGAPEIAGQQFYYGVRSAGVMPGYHRPVAPVERQGSVPEMRSAGNVSQTQ
ncbi:hypothetical protein Sjap_003555 [Stephania japonica]|uniref:PB1 domain-containing protein n=1 Tax=Stephania japonica TaxID=461633 RepID=A0AAP0KRM5_9MAGN